ncbi:hypothetical protein CEXT_132331 [Caerostris extrusa]|uniref:Uncharacterized protein n=1 Tax=Caerostris extrusa TaxID=172846 RepID=A0AAV4UA59_CAEEX|nr:hypothetical protein CEXT_132331 [Caerostris extrusa]
MDTGSLAERSKGPVLGASLFGDVGSIPPLPSILDRLNLTPGQNDYSVAMDVCSVSSSQEDISFQASGKRRIKFHPPRQTKKVEKHGVSYFTQVPHLCQLAIALGDRWPSSTSQLATQGGGVADVPENA